MKKASFIIFILLISLSSCNKVGELQREDVSLFTYYISTPHRITIDYWNHGTVNSVTIYNESWHYTFEADPSVEIQIKMHSTYGATFQGYLGYEGKKVVDFPSQNINPNHSVTFKSLISQLIPQ